MAVLLTLGVVFSALAAWVSLTVVIPSCLRSSLVGDLWQIRDSLVADLLDNESVDRDSATSLVGTIELLIRNARKITPARAYFFSRMPDTLAASVPTLLPDPSGVGGEQLSLYRRQVEQRVQRFLCVGSLSAWLVFPVRFLFAREEPSLPELCRGLALLEHFDALELGSPYA